jgi:hypothetical protein
MMMELVEVALHKADGVAAARVVYLGPEKTVLQKTDIRMVTHWEKGTVTLKMN